MQALDATPLQPASRGHEQRHRGREQAVGGSRVAAVDRRLLGLDLGRDPVQALAQGGSVALDLAAVAGVVDAVSSTI